MRQAVGTHILVRIDQFKKQNKKFVSENSKILVPPKYEYLMYNLQYGEILSVGENVNNPDIQVGNTAIIIHTIEERADRVVDRIPNATNPDLMDDVRVVNASATSFSYEIFGVIDKDNNIIPLDLFVFCLPEKEIPKDPALEKTVLTFLAENRVAFETRKVGSLYLPEFQSSETEPAFVRTIITHVAPTEATLAPHDLIEAFSHAAYPLELLGKKYLIISREDITLKFSTNGALTV